MSSQLVAPAATTVHETKPFQERHNLDERVLLSSKAMKKYIGHIPVILEKSSSSSLPSIGKVKFMVQKENSVAQFLSSIRKKLTIREDESLFLFVNNTIPTAVTTFEQLYSMHANVDGFLYASYQEESVYGN